MTERVDKLEADVAKAVKLGWATFGCGVVSILLRLLPVVHHPSGVQSFAPAPAQATRAVVKYITEGRLDPPPVKDGKTYRIAAEYRILPHPAE